MVDSLRRATCLAGMLLVFGCASDRSGLLEGYGPVEGASAAPPPQIPQDFRGRVADLVARASEQGDATLADEAYALAETWTTDQPDDVAPRAWKGSARVLQARFASSPFRKMSWVKEGLADLESALAERPDDPELRFLRAQATFPLPSFMKQRQVAKDDLEWLVASEEGKGARLSALTPRMQALAYLQLGVLLREDGEEVLARSRFQQAREAAPDSAPARRATAALAQEP